MDRYERQERVFEWVTRAFGPDHANSVKQRAIRFFEEAIELYQAAGADRDMAHKLLDFVFDKPAGELPEELGAAGLTLISVAAAAGLCADCAERAEVERVTAIDPAVMAARNRAKNEAGFDAGAYPIGGRDEMV